MAEARVRHFQVARSTIMVVVVGLLIALAVAFPIAMGIIGALSAFLMACLVLMVILHWGLDLIGLAPERPFDWIPGVAAAAGNMACDLGKAVLEIFLVLVNLPGQIVRAFLSPGDQGVSDPASGPAAGAPVVGMPPMAPAGVSAPVAAGEEATAGHVPETDPSPAGLGACAEGEPLDIPSPARAWAGLALRGSVVLMSLAVFDMGYGFGLLPEHFQADAGILFLLTLVAMWCSRASVRFDPGRRVVRFRWVNPLYHQSREIPFDGIEGIAVRGEMQGFPLLLNWFSFRYSLVLVTRAREILELDTVTLGSGEVRQAFESATGRARELAAGVGLPFLMEEGQVSAFDLVPVLGKGSPAAANPAGHGDPLVKALVASSLFFEVGADGEVKIPVSTMLEKALLGLLTLGFLGVTGWMIATQWSFLASHPRAWYLLLLDSATVVVSLLWIWNRVIDEYYVVDLASGWIRFHSRILWWEREEPVLSFSQVAGIHVMEDPWAVFGGVPVVSEVLSTLFGFQYHLVVQGKDGRELALSETIHRHQEVPLLWAEALSYWAWKRQPPR
ncbi:MAG: hypothetical protein GX442_25145 [Candidatus Riflebacteria bacterium]|nr:hypothetical protein [Candidatus Riflebacteria bacterium]